MRSYEHVNNCTMQRSSTFTQLDSKHLHMHEKPTQFSTIKKKDSN